MTPKIGVILFPGTNCELEALRACKRSHMKPELFRWNDDSKKLKAFDGFIIPGGFSYEDRGRSGVIASKDPIMDIIKKEADKGKPVIGICNGAQILVEKGMIPGLEVEKLEMSLAWNRRVKNGKILGTGFFNDWIYIRHDVKPGRSAFNRFSQKLIMRIPIANGEGRFTTTTKHLLENLIANGQTVFRYCDENGKIIPAFPVNPNGTIYNLAGVCNPYGNVMSLMPHPERTINGQAIFDSMAEYITAGPHSIPKTLKSPRNLKSVAEKIEAMSKKPSVAIKVKLIITDNEEKTIEKAIQKIGFKDAALKRQLYYGFYAPKQTNLKQLAEKIITSGEVLNLNKEIPEVTIGKKHYRYEKLNGLVEQENTNSNPAQTTTYSFIVFDNDNFSGKNLMEKLKHYLKKGEITKTIKGVYWTLAVKNEERAQQIVDTHIFHNPHSMKIFKD
jgi:phosphoribosylformylglycinamidine synthase I